MNRLLRLDWDIIAGIAAAVLAIVLHLLHVVELDVLLTITLVLLALLLFRDLRRESHDEHVAAMVRQTQRELEEVQSALRPAEATLIGPRTLRAESRRFAESARGEMVWFNVCSLMFRSQEVFDLLLKPAIENPAVVSIRFVSSHTEREAWQQHVAPKIAACRSAHKVAAPCWRDLPETVSFILADVQSSGATEALLSFWGEPFMARSTQRQVPRYIFHVRGHSELIGRLTEVERNHRLGGAERREG